MKYEDLIKDKNLENLARRMGTVIVFDTSGGNCNAEERWKSGKKKYPQTLMTPLGLKDLVLTYPELFEIRTDHSNLDQEDVYPVIIVPDKDALPPLNDQEFV
jgi:hypothetical protein